jgi:hypothetical protein
MRMIEKQRWLNYYYYYYSFPISSGESQATDGGMLDANDSEVQRVWV